MTGFDAVLIGAIGGVACVFIGLIANWNEENSKSKQWGTALAVGIAFIAIICCLALGLNWPSDILAGIFPGHPGGSTGNTEPTYPTEPTKVIETEEKPAVAPTPETTVPKESPIPDKLKIGDTLTFGAYEQDGFAPNGQEPIEWVVLDKADGKALLLSTKAIDCIPYNDQYAGCTWATCSLRKWLNDTFYKAAFSNEEREWILKSRVAAHENPDSSTNPGMDTDDYIFLLSVDEVKYYLPNDSDRMCSPTEYAVTQGAFREYRLGTCWWWLRTPGETSQDASSINADGSIDTGKGSVNSGKGCIRPAMWVQIGD